MLRISSVSNRLFRSPGRTLLLSIIATIIAGSLLLNLSYAQQTPQRFIDVFFTATSATCVTGLVTTPLSGFTFFGKCVLLCLVQIGGLSLVTLSVFLLSLFFSVGMKPHLMAGQQFEVESWKNSKRILIFVILLTALVEMCGTIAGYLSLPTSLGPWTHRLFFAAFHSISSFCSAGFSIFHVPFIFFKNNIPFLLTTIALMLIGGLGFMTWYDIYTYTFHRTKTSRLSLQSKITLTSTLLLVIIGSLLFWTLTYSSQGVTLANIIHSLFSAVSSRSTGFLLFSPLQTSILTLFIILMIGFIGSAPGSTGSGIKTTSFVLFFATVRAIIRGKSSVELWGRKIPNDQIIKALLIIVLGVAWVCLSTGIILGIEKNISFFKAFFESVTAFANLGIATTVTSQLQTWSKIILIISMVFGRIGSLTLILSIRRKKEKAVYQYPEERVILG